MVIMFTKIFGKLKSFQNCLVYLKQITTKIIMQQRFFNYFKGASTDLLTALVVAEGSAFINIPSGF